MALPVKVLSRNQTRQHQKCLSRNSHLGVLFIHSKTNKLFKASPQKWFFAHSISCCTCLCPLVDHNYSTQTHPINYFIQLFGKTSQCNNESFILLSWKKNTSVYLFFTQSTLPFWHVPHKTCPKFEENHTSQLAVQCKSSRGVPSLFFQNVFPSHLWVFRAFTSE